MIKQQFSPLVRHGATYRSLIIGSVAALTLLLSWGIVPRINPITKEFLIEDHALTYRQWNDLLDRHDVILGLTWQFGTTGSTLTLGVGFNTASNNIYTIGAGAGGVVGTSCTGGNGGGGGAFATIANYSTHGAGFAVPIQVGTSDSWFSANTTVLAKAASTNTGGLLSTSVGTTKFAGGNGLVTTSCNFGGGGGGGAAGLHGAGGNASLPHGGGTGDSGNTAAGANGTQFDASHGSGGGGAGGNNCLSGTNGGSYGGGGGGGGYNLGAAGAGFQGLIAVSYTTIGIPYFQDEDITLDIARRNWQIRRVPT